MPSTPAAHAALLAAAIPMAAVGGAVFLRGVVGVAASLRVPELLVATVIAAMCTSSPEMAVSTLAALSGRPEIGLGDALGSNVVNLGLILGASLLFGALRTQGDALQRDFAWAVAVPGVTLLLVADGELARWDGLLLLAALAVWFTLVLRQAFGHRRGPGPDAAAAGVAWRPWSFLLLGLLALVLAGRLFVDGASGIAFALGVHPYLIGVTIVAMGTSLPELVTVMLARWRGHDDVGLGTLLGSNLFNGMGIVGLAATIHPIRVSAGEASIALVAGLLTVVLMLPRDGCIPRRRGFSLLAVYAASLAVVLYQGS